MPAGSRCERAPGGRAGWRGRAPGRSGPCGPLLTGSLLSGAKRGQGLLQQCQGAGGSPSARWACPMPLRQRRGCVCCSLSAAWKVALQRRNCLSASRTRPCSSRHSPQAMRNRAPSGWEGSEARSLPSTASAYSRQASCVRPRSARLDALFCVASSRLGTAGSVRRESSSWKKEGPCAGRALRTRYRPTARTCCSSGWAWTERWTCGFRTHVHANDRQGRERLCRYGLPSKTPPCVLFFLCSRRPGPVRGGSRCAPCGLGARELLHLVEAF